MKTRLCTPCFALVEPSRLLRFACLLCLPDIRHFLPNGIVLGVRVGHGLAGGEGGVKGVLVRARARALSPDPDLPPFPILVSQNTSADPYTLSSSMVELLHQPRQMDAGSRILSDTGLARVVTRLSTG